MAAFVILVAFILTGLMDLQLRKKFNIARNETFMDQYVNRTHFFLEALACVLFMTYISGNGLMGLALYAQLFLFLAFFFGSRALAEVVFLREKRKHLMSMGYAAVCLVCSAGFFLTI